MSQRRDQYSKQFNIYFLKLTDFFEEYLVKRAPTIPTKWQLILVKFLPWVTLIFLVLSLPIILAVLGMVLALIPGSTVGLNYTLAQFLLIVILLTSLVLEAIALPKLFKVQKRGWDLLYYSTLIGAVHSLLTTHIIGALLGLLISLYIIFQIRHYYK